MEFDRTLLKTKEGTMLLLILGFAISLLVPVAAHFYTMFVLPIVVSYFFAPFLAEVVFFAHRRMIFSKNLRSISNYYRFLISDITFMKILEFSFYPFLFFISILLQTGQPSLEYVFGMGAFFTTLSFPVIFLLSSVTWLLDQSGLRFVNSRNQYIERLGYWFSTKFRGFASAFVVASLVISLINKGASIETMKEILWVSAIIYVQVLVSTFIYLKFALRRDLEKFESILSETYGVSSERKELSIRKTKFFF